MARYTDLDQALANPEDVTELDLSKQNLESLPTEIGKMKNLVSLNLSGNKLIVLPDEIRQLSNLKSLSLTANPEINLDQVSAQISSLPNLTQQGGSIRPSVLRKKIRENTSLRDQVYTSLDEALGNFEYSELEKTLV